jgi:hypothetical protein
VAKKTATAPKQEEKVVNDRVLVHENGSREGIISEVTGVDAVQYPFDHPVFGRHELVSLDLDHPCKCVAGAAKTLTLLPLPFGKCETHLGMKPGATKKAKKLWHGEKPWTVKCPYCDSDFDLHPADMENLCLATLRRNLSGD